MPAPSGCVVVHVPAGREGIERAEADDLAERLASLPEHWRVVVTSPSELNAADLERVTGRRTTFRKVRDLDPRGTIAFLTECDDLWDPGRPSAPVATVSGMAVMTVTAKKAAMTAVTAMTVWISS